jgi:hypothetical protein
MKTTASSWITATGALCCLLAGPAYAGPPDVVDGVAVSASAAPAAITSSSIDFDTPELFSDTLPLRLFHTLLTGAYFFGKGAVLDAASFEVTGTSGTSILAFNGRTAVNGDGTIPELPEFVLFLKPGRLGLSPKQTVSVDVGSRRDEGRTVTLVAFNRRFRRVASSSIQVSPQMQTLTVSTPTPQIILIGLYGDSELKVLAVDNLIYN